VVGLLLGELVRGEFIGWSEPDSFGGNRNPAGIWKNPKESKVIWWKYRNSVLQEFLQKNPVKVAENSNS
jgi:hypothetical protein